MSDPIQTGDPRPILEDPSIGFEPGVGQWRREIWTGSEKAMLGLHAEKAIAGYRSQARKLPGSAKWECEIYYGNDQQIGDTEEIPVDKYELETELAQNSLESHPYWVSVFGSSYNLSYWLESINVAIREKAQPVIPQAWVAYTAFIQELYDLIVAGVQGYEVNRVILSWSRIVSNAYEPRMAADVIPTLYKTARLVADFGIPSPFSNRLPADPPPAATPIRTTWGWSTRRQRLSVNDTVNKLVESREWVFGAHVTSLYTLVA